MIRIWALADLHLSFGTPGKEMDVFGPQWTRHYEKIEMHWRNSINEDDLVLLAGDISWAMKLEEAQADLEWLDALPGTKVLVRGNHDYWWTSLKKVESTLPDSLHVIQNNTFFWNGIAIAGARLWDTSEYQFGEYIEYKENPRENVLTKVEDPQEIEKIFDRELGRLELSLKHLPKRADLRIAMTHYPPIGADLAPSRASALLHQYGIEICVFGHLHNVVPGTLPFGSKDGITYHLTAADYLNFKPLLIKDFLIS